MELALERYSAVVIDGGLQSATEYFGLLTKKIVCMLIKVRIRVKRKVAKDLRLQRNAVTSMRTNEYIFIAQSSPSPETQ